MDLKAVLDAVYVDENRPLVFGHRGASAYAPMNTLPAFELAAEQGADGIELDVHRSKDGAAVIVHDFEIDTTTDGRGLVVEKTLAELKEYDAGGWFSPDYRGTRIPTLDEVFEAVRDRLFINVEIKSHDLNTDGVEQVVADVIQKYDMARRVIVSSFNPLALIRFRQIMPGVALGYLYAPEMPTLPIDIINELTYEAVHPYHEMIDPDHAATAKSRGHRLNTWTVNDPERARNLRDWGVDGLITDVPDVILNAIGR